MEAGAAELVAVLDAGDAHAELRRADRRDIAAGTAADDDDIETFTHRRCLCRSSRSHIEEDTLRVLDAFLDADQEGHRLAAVDDAMIVAQRQIHHRSDLDLVADNDWALVDLVHAENGRLPRADDASF